MDKVTLLPCPNPWCHSGVRPMPFIQRSGKVAVICGCDFHGPSKPSRDDAIAAWNTRATPAPDSEKLREALALVDELERLKSICDQAIADGFGADHRLIILANYGDLALKLAPSFRAALGASL